MNSDLCDQSIKLDFSRFVANLHKFVSDLNRYVPNNGCTKFLEVFSKLDMNRILIKYLNSVRPVEIKLKNRDESVFTSKFIPIPGIDLTSLFKQLQNDRQKTKVWTYLQILYVHAEMIAKYGTEEKEKESDTKLSKDLLIKNIYDDVKSNIMNSTDTDTDTQLTTESDTQMMFNPYIGIGSDDTDYSVDDILAGPMSMPDDGVSKPSFDSMIKLLGVDKMLNIEALKHQLQNMSEQDIEEATQQVKAILGDNADNEKTSNLISNMLHSIQDELKHGEMNNNSNNNPFDSMMNIAEKVAAKMRPNIKEEDIEHLAKSAENMNMNINMNMLTNNPQLQHMMKMLQGGKNTKINNRNNKNKRNNK